MFIDNLSSTVMIYGICKICKIHFHSLLNANLLHKCLFSYAELNLKDLTLMAMPYTISTTREGKKLVDENNNSLLFHLFVAVTAELRSP